MASLYVPDFSKIFAQNASSIQNWSDANYNTGWGFLGQEPPPYELFDDLFRKNDQKNKYLFDEVTDAKSRLTAAESGIQTLNSNLNTVTTNYLSKLTGGTVSGSTTFSGNLYTSQTLSTTDKSLYVPNTTWVHNLINYFLTTANNTQNNAFKTAVQNAIAAGYHGITQDFSNPNAWWCKFPNGVIIQGIKVSGTTGGSLNSGYSEGEKLITYPIPFKELLGFASGLVDTSATFVEHASVNPNNSNARVFLHALTATNVEITTWIWLVGI